MPRPMTITEKILAAHADLDEVTPGQLIDCRLDLVLANDITAPIAIREFGKTGASKVWDPAKIALVPDHYTPNKDIKSAEQAKLVRQFAREQEITHYYEIGCMGVEHALLPEQGVVGPGDVIIGADSHTCTYGALGAFATGVGSTDAAAGMATGSAWFKVPASIRFNVTGQLGAWVSGKDVILHIIGLIGVDGALYQAMEFTGDTIARLGMDERLTICNMAIEAGAKSGIIAVDDITRTYVRNRFERTAVEYFSYPDATYAAVYEIDAARIVPTVAWPHLPSNTRPAADSRDVWVDQVVIGSCTNGRIEDLRAAAEIAKGRKVASNVSAMVVPGSGLVKAEAEREGLDKIFIEAGFEWRLQGCSMCLAMNADRLDPGQRCASTSNRNFEGRQGRGGRTHLLSPAMAAAAAIKGTLADVRDYQ